MSKWVSDLVVLKGLGGLEVVYVLTFLLQLIRVTLSAYWSYDGALLILRWPQSVCAENMLWFAVTADLCAWFGCLPTNCKHGPPTQG
jgi:hypothetical protein